MSYAIWRSPLLKCATSGGAATSAMGSAANAARTETRLKLMSNHPHLNRDDSIPAPFALELPQVCELLHQLLHSMLRKQHCELSFVALALAHHHGAFAVLAVAHALPLLQARSTRRFRYVHLRSC